MNKAAGVKGNIPATQVKEIPRKSVRKSDIGILERANTRKFTNIDHGATLANPTAELGAASPMPLTNVNLSDAVTDETSPWIMILLLQNPASNSGKLVSRNYLL
jgi:hypothetical protein